MRDVRLRIVPVTPMVENWSIISRIRIKFALEQFSFCWILREFKLVDRLANLAESVGLYA